MVSEIISYYLLLLNKAEEFPCNQQEKNISSSSFPSTRINLKENLCIYPNKTLGEG